MTTDCGSTVDIDLATKPPLRLGVDCGGTLWLDRPGDITRVRAPDLRTLSQRASTARRRHPFAAVLADIEVAVACDARSARTSLAAAGGAPDHDVLQYVGTVAGLAGLISDLFVLGLVDGAVLMPLAGHTAAELIHGEIADEIRGFMPV